MAHLIISPAICSCQSKVDPCPSCDHGLSVCFYCGKAEVDLDQPCTTDWKKRLARRGAWKLNYLRYKNMPSNIVNWNLAEEAWRKASGETTDPIPQ